MICEWSDPILKHYPSVPGQHSRYNNQAMRYPPDDWGSILSRGRDFSLRHSVQTGCGPIKFFCNGFRGKVAEA
jgi:hypothetical protein